MPTEPRWTTETYDPTDPANYPDHPDGDDFDEPGDEQGTDTLPADDDDQAVDVSDTQTGQGVD